MEMPRSAWPPKGRAAVVAWSGAAAAALFGVVAAFAWPALVRPEPPLEAAAGRDGVRINLVQPPRPAATPPVSRLDVGLSEAALAMANGRQALTSVWDPAAAPPSRPAPSPRLIARAETTPLLVEDDAAPPPRDEEIDDRWNRDRDSDDRYEADERRRWEAERLARDERAERRALRRAERQGELDRWDDRVAPRDDHEAPPPDDRVSPNRW
jgi:hypothetical protein